MKFQVISAPLEKVKAEALVVLHEEGGMLAHSGNKVIARHLDGYAKQVKEKRSKREWFCQLEKEAAAATPYMLLDSATFGPNAPHDEPLKIAAARAVALCRDYTLTRIAFVVHHKLAAEKAAAILEGALLGDFTDQRFKGGKGGDRKPLELVFVVEAGALKSVKTALEERAAVIDGQNAARELVNAPHDVLTPDAMAKYAQALAKRHRMKCVVLDEKQIRKQGYLPTWHVGRGSEYPPRMMVLQYRPARVTVKEHIGLVGKGMTFDSGGLCIKTKADMHRMNNDMGGAAAVLGAMEAIARLKLPIKVTAIIASAHNAVDGAAFHPGCILKARNGKTIYVENTDAEGRLILSDCLYRAGEERVDQIWDFATLTGAVSAALGPSIAGLFTDDEALRTLFMKASAATGDDLWPLPLVKEYEASIKHHLADLNNMSSEATGNGIHAANFLKAFVPEGKRWLHVDIAGVATTSRARRYYRTGATGFGVRLIVEALRGLVPA
jgi:leucyl aminopeptidase